MAQGRDRLPRPNSSQPERGLLAVDYRFVPDRVPSLKPFRVEHEKIHLLTQPLALDRLYFLRDDADVKLQIGFRLCWNGAGDAIESLYQFVESFQRAVPIDRVRRISDEGIGWFGLAWTWDDPFGAQVAAFVRNNLLVTAVAADAAGLPERAARELDEQLQGQRTMDAYPEVEGGVLGKLRVEGRGLERGGKLVLGEQPGAERWFFVTSKGAANREASAPATWYFRAPLTPGPAEIRLFRADAGLIPVVERLTVDVR